MITLADLSQIPAITEEQLEHCRSNKDYRPILFEWYKFVGEFSNFVARLRPDSSAFLQVEPLHHAIFIGLLNRCSRLMLANINLSHQGLYGETTAIIDRCIFESCIKIIWICDKNTKEKFQQYLADGFKAELKLRDKINKNVASRNKRLIIEDRMLKSIDRYIASSNLRDDQIRKTKKLPTLFDMITEIEGDDLSYIVGQKIGSHHVHGTWPSLFMHYLKLDDSGFFALRDHDCETHVNQYVVICFSVLRAIETYIKFIIFDKATKDSFLETIKAIKDEISKLNQEIIGDDFESLDV